MTKGKILSAKINTYLGGCFVLAFGIFALTIGFHIQDMENPIADAIAAQQIALSAF